MGQSTNCQLVLRVNPMKLKWYQSPSLTKEEWPKKGMLPILDWNLVRDGLEEPSSREVVLGNPTSKVEMRPK